MLYIPYVLNADVRNVRMTFRGHSRSRTTLIITLYQLCVFNECCVQLAAVNNCIEDWRIAMTGQMLAQIIVELTVCAVHPPPGTFYFSAALVRHSPTTLSLC